MMTTDEIKGTFLDTIAAFQRSWGYTRSANGRHIVNAVKAHPWLRIHADARLLELAEKASAM